MSQPRPASSDPTPQSLSPNTPSPGAAGTEPGCTQPQPPSAFYAAVLAPPQLPDEIGRLGSYRVLRLIGQGGMGFVFAAEELRPKRDVAIKVMRPEVAAQAEARGRFLREANAAAALSNDHVVTIFRVDEEGGVPFLVMPLMPGETLHDRLKRQRKLPLLEAVRIGREAAKGLAAAHAAGLIHRDVKPANLWLETRSVAPGTPALGARVKMLDFGLALPEAGVTRLTATGTMLGTPGYMAPEQARGQEIDARADLFSLGCVLYELTTGVAPFRGNSVMEVLCKLLEYDPPPPHALDSTVPARLSALVMRLIAKDMAGRMDAAGRPATAAAVVAELKAIRADLSGSQPASTAVVPTKAKSPAPSGARPKVAPITKAPKQPTPSASSRATPKTAPSRPRPPAGRKPIIRVAQPATRRDRRWIVVGGVAAILGAGLIGLAARSWIGKTDDGKNVPSTGGPPPTSLVAAKNPPGDANAAAPARQAPAESGVVVPAGTLPLDLGEGVTLTLVPIPAGKFMMGKTPNDGDADDNEKLAHQVTISKPFFLGQTEVTVGQFRRFVAAMNHRTEAEQAGNSQTWRKPSYAQTEEHPVVWVSWNDASNFCEWLGAKTGKKVVLPTEAEWEYGCRAGSATRFAFGDDVGRLDEFAWYNDNSGGEPHPCGRKAPNAWNLYDMHGNVWEWCRDGQRRYALRPETDPVGPTGPGAPRAKRGASFDLGAHWFRASLRYEFAPTNRVEHLGFRVAVAP